MGFSGEGLLLGRVLLLGEIWYVGEQVVAWIKYCVYKQMVTKIPGKHG